jgi:hypothetical protein
VSVSSGQSGNVLWTVLSGFDWDSDELQPDHIRWAQTAAREIALRGGMVVVLGAADRSRASGARGAQRNEQLALERANAVIERLRREVGPNAPLNFFATGLGDRYAQAPVGQDRSASDRYVIVAQVIAADSTPVPAPPPAWLQCTLAPCPSTHFYIRCTGVLTMGATGGAGVLSGGVNGVVWQMMISDGVWGQRYTFEGGSASGGFGLGPRSIPDVLPSFSVGEGGPWHRFTTRTPALVSSFSPSRISFSSASAGVSEARGSTALEVRLVAGPVSKTWHDFQLGDQVGIDTLTNMISANADGTFGALSGRTEGRPDQRSGFYPGSRCVRLFNTGNDTCAD